MPLARILTAYPERAETLARELKDQGYNVEFLSPEKAGMLRADLEIDFEICDQKVVLRRAAELANKLHADIAVSPEALPANFVATESEIYVGENQIVEVPSQMPDPYVETFLAQGERTGQIRNLENSEHMVSLPPDMLSENTQASASAEIVPPEQTHSQQSLIEPTAAAPVNSEPMQARSQDPARMEDRSREDRSREDRSRIEEPIRTIDVPIVPDPERHAEGTYGFETHGFESQSPAAQVHDPAMAHDRGPEKVVRTPKQEWIERAGALSSSALAAGKHTSASLLASLRRFGGDCAEWINLRLAAAQDARHRRQMDAEKQRELARARAEELEVARDAAAARLQELLRERGGLTEHQPIPPAVPAYQSSEPSRLNRAAIAAWFERVKDIALTRKYGQQWEAVLMGVAAACALFVVGVAVNSFRPHPALSNSISRPSSSPAPVAARASTPNQPYNGVTVQGGKPGVTLLPSPVKTASATPNPAPAATNKPSPRENDVIVRHINNKLTSRRSDGSIAQDVTIRHFNQQPKPAARNSADGVKRFSDLD
jgi:hypothetical protein